MHTGCAGLILVLTLALFVNTLKNYWVGPEVNVEAGLIVQSAFFVLLQALAGIYMQFLNGIGKIKLRLITSLFTRIFNLPLSYFFVAGPGFGSAGMLRATNVS